MGNAILLVKVSNGIYLILHQCDERRDYDCSSLHYERRQLITQRFTSAGRHQHKGIFTIEQIFYNSLLVTFECVESEILLKNVG